MAATGLPSGEVSSAPSVFTSSGMEPAKSHRGVSASLALANGYSTGPARTGPTGRADIERGDHAEMPPPPRRPQNRSAFSVAARHQHRAVGGDEIDGEEVVANQAVPAGEPAETATKRQSADPGMGDGAARGG